MPLSSIAADTTPPPPHVQTEIDNLNQQIELLKTRRKQLEAKIQPGGGPNQEFQNQQIRGQIELVDQQIKFLQDQRDKLTNSAASGS
jgi:prefoldin subunit 5